MELIHCIYCSTATNADLSTGELEQILQESRMGNEKIDVTGILLFDSGTFFQVLEGDRRVVEDLYARIETDTRHTQVKKLISEPIEERSFGEWTMGYPKVTARDLSEIPGLNDFFSKGLSFMDLEKGRARTLISAFKKGKWRSSVE